MIKNQWYAVLSSHHLKKGKVLTARCFGENLVVADMPIIEYRTKRKLLQEKNIMV